MLSIKVAPHQHSAESIVIRGPSTEVDRAILEIESIIQEAEQDRRPRER